MKNFILTMFALLVLLVPAISFAQPVPPRYHGYMPPPPPLREQYCYTVLLPIPHVRCEYRYVPGYMPPPPPRHYRPLPPPSPHRGGHHGPHHGKPGPRH